MPTKPKKAGDSRGGFQDDTVEAEAMPAGPLRGLLRTEIQSFLPEQQFIVIKEAEESERAYIRRVAEIMRDGAA